MTATRVLLVDEHVLFRRGVAALLAAERDFELAGEASDGLEALEMARRLMPDVILVGVSPQPPDALDAVSRLAHEAPGARVVVLGVSDDDRAPLEAAGSRVQAFLERGIEPRALLDALRQVARGEVPRRPPPERAIPR